MIGSVASERDQSTSRRAGVQFVISEPEMPAFNRAGPKVVGPSNFYVLAAPVNPDLEPIPGGNPSLGIYVEALDDDEAQAKAEELYAQMRTEGGLPPAGPRVTGLFWGTDKHPLWRQHFDEAQDLLDQQRHEMAVVTAQVACEIEIRAAVVEVANAPAGSLAQIAIKSPRSYSLIDQRAQAIFKALLGQDPKQQPFWRDYQDHVARRNNVLHAGARVTREDARSSILAAEEMVAWVQSARQSAFGR